VVQVEAPQARENLAAYLDKVVNELDRISATGRYYLNQAEIIQVKYLLNEAHSFTKILRRRPFSG
jgi:hypothetical protein